MTTRTVLVDADPQHRVELAHVLERAGFPVAVAGDMTGAYVEMLAGEEPRSSGRRGRPSLAELERRYAREVLRETGGNKTRAAEILGIDRKTLYRLIGEAHRRVAQPPAVQPPVTVPTPEPVNG
jgi:transcriptional regulator with PAS, ATPase and Fis domain